MSQSSIIKRIDEIAIVKGGKRVPKGYKLLSTPTKYPYLTVTDFTHEGTIDTSNLKYIDEETYKQIKNYTISFKDIYISIAGTIGKSGMVPLELDGANLTENACKVILNQDINQKYFYYFTLSKDFIDQTGLNTKTTTQPKLALERLKTITLPVPSVVEQKRIVAILDEAFAGISQTIANTEKNLANARELFESYLNEIFTNQSLKLVKLSDISESISDGDHAPPPKASEGIPFITISNINKETREIDFSDTFKVPPSYYKGLKKNRRPQAGDILYTVTGSFGIPVKVVSDFDFCFQRHIGLIRPKSEINTNWLYYALLSPFVFKQANEQATGTAQKTVSLNVLRNIRIPLMDAADQFTTANYLNSLWDKSQKLTLIYQQKLQALAELKQSLLQKAFSGELTANNVDKWVNP